MRELAGQCYVCKQERFRDEFELWIYHVSVGLVCKHHHGVRQWYNDLFAKTFGQLDNPN